MRQLGAIFGPLVEAATPYWWRYAVEQSLDPRLARAGPVRETRCGRRRLASA